MSSSNEEYGQINIGCLKHIGVTSACEVESNYLMVKLEVEFEDQVDNENSLDLHYAS